MHCLCSGKKKCTLVAFISILFYEILLQSLEKIVLNIKNKQLVKIYVLILCILYMNFIFKIDFSQIALLVGSIILPRF